VKVLATEPINRLTCQLVARGRVVMTKTIAVPNSTEHEFSINPTAEMVPRANLIVYYFTDDGEIISDQKDIFFEDEDKANFVCLMFASTSSEELIMNVLILDQFNFIQRSQPGELLDITINSNPNSFMYRPKHFATEEGKRS